MYTPALLGAQDSVAKKAKGASTAWLFSLLFADLGIEARPQRLVPTEDFGDLFLTPGLVWPREVSCVKPLRHGV